MKVLVVFGTLAVLFVVLLTTVVATLVYVGNRSAAVERLIETEQFDAALPAAQSNVAWNRRLVSILPGESRSDNLAESLMLLGQVHQALGNTEEVEDLFQEAIDLSIKAQGRQSHDYAIYSNQLSLFYYETGEFEKGLPLAEASLDSRRVVFGPRSLDYSVGLNNLALHAHAMEQYDRAVALYEEALGLLEQREELGGAHHELYASNFADLYEDMDESEKSLELRTQLVDSIREKSGDESPELAGALNTLGNYYYQEGDMEAAVGVYGQAISIWESLEATNAEEYETVLGNIATALGQLEEYAQSEAKYRQLLSVLADTRGKESDEYLSTLGALANVCDMQEKLTEAEDLYRQAVALTESAYGTGSDEHAETLANIGWFFKGNEQFEAAEAEFLTAVALVKEHTGVEGDAYVDALDRLFWFYRYSKSPERAEAHYLESVQVQIDRFGEGSAEHLYQLDTLHEYYEEIDAIEKAEAVWIDLLAWQKKGGEESREAYLHALTGYGDFCGRNNAPDKAVKCHEEALEGWVTLKGKDSTEYSLALWNFAHLQTELDNVPAAASLYEEMLVIDRRLEAENPVALARTIAMVGRFYADNDQYAPADKLLREALGIYEGIDEATGDYSYYNCKINLAGVLKDTGAFEEAESILKTALESQMEKMPKYNHMEADIRKGLGELYLVQERLQDAQSYLASAKVLLEGEGFREGALFVEICTALAASYTAMGMADEAATILAEIPVKEGEEGSADPETESISEAGSEPEVAAIVVGE